MQPTTRPLPTIQKPIQRAGFSVSIRELNDGRLSLRKVQIKSSPGRKRAAHGASASLFTPMTLKSTATMRSPGGTPMRVPLAARINND
jgi:hypothetical protein